MIYILHDRSIETWREQAPQIDVHTPEALYSFISSGSAAAIKEWVRNGMTQSPEEVAAFIDKATRSVERSFLE
ncbi:hypothetical protein M2277_005824 [Paenibacillus sp. LBL]|nr:hypothetical protein [Paenibacillus sp. LBL]